ncbi:MAG: hypothetical protein IKJ16_03065 [Agathobacter sp.]|nr:hypothetical protein [Agathobacter sp.]
MQFTIKLADCLIAIDSRYDYIKEYCKDYIVPDEEASMHISVTEQEIQEEQNADKTHIFPSSYLETIAVLRKIGEELAKKNRMLFHGVVLSYKEDGYLFTAASGTGKSTHAGLWKKYLKDAVQVVNGDKPILAVEGGRVIAYGTPWAGKEGWQANRKVELKGICIIERGLKNEIHRVNPQQYIDTLFRQIHIPRDPQAAGKTLELFDEFMTKVPLYVLKCDISEDAVKCCYEALTGLDYERNKAE